MSSSPSPPDPPGGPPPPVPPEPAPHPPKYRSPSKAELERYYHAEQGRLEAERMRLEYGWLARLIGRNNASHNIAFVIVVALLLVGAGATLARPDNYLDYWRLIIPVLTLTLGYLFGRNAKD